MPINLPPPCQHMRIASFFHIIYNIRIIGTSNDITHIYLYNSLTYVLLLLKQVLIFKLARERRELKLYSIKKIVPIYKVKLKNYNIVGIK